MTPSPSKPAQRPSVPAPSLTLSGWGRYPVITSRVRQSEDLAASTRGAILSRGLGRAYGDAALAPEGSPTPLACTPPADRILAFDQVSGRIRVEAGFSLAELARLLLPRGWFTPVSPGTRYVTAGGMVASDIHGKNHHVHGSFSRWVRALRLRTGAGDLLTVSPEQGADLFWATAGGMGLTGHILEVDFQLERLPSPWIYEETERFNSLEEVFHHLGQASAVWPMTVAWVDTTATGARRGRGIVMAGRWAQPSEAPPHPPGPSRSLPFPFTLPDGLMNPHTIALANTAFFFKHPRRRVRHVVDPKTFFWMLDAVRLWNRAYGKRGFTQYQCVLPSDLRVYDEFVRRFQALGGASFVTVFKDCGAEGPGHLSFLQPGTSMALDVPITADTPRLVRELNAYVLAHGGRVYLAKDAFTTEAEFRRMYPRFDEWQAIRRRYDPQRTIRSALSVRLMGD